MGLRTEYHRSGFEDRVPLEWVCRQEYYQLVKYNQSGFADIVPPWWVQVVDSVPPKRACSHSATRVGCWWIINGVKENNAYKHENSEVITMTTPDGIQVTRYLSGMTPIIIIVAFYSVKHITLVNCY